MTGKASEMSSRNAVSAWFDVANRDSSCSARCCYMPKRIDARASSSGVATVLVRPAITMLIFIVHSRHLSHLSHSPQRAESALTQQVG
jgi:hypothetical protein